MLLDEKRTKRIVRIVAILTSIAFAGVGVLVIALVIFGGTPTASEQLVKDAKAEVERTPNDPDSWSSLASAYLADDKPDLALDPALRAVRLAPRDYEYTQTLVRVHVELGRQDQAVNVLQQFTRRVSDEPQAFLQLGQLAQQLGRIPLARLSYQAYLRLNPEGATAEAVRAELTELANPAGAATTP